MSGLTIGQSKGYVEITPHGMLLYSGPSGYLKITTEDNINYGIIKAVEPYNMQVFIDVINCEDEIIVYVYIQSKMDVPAIFKNKIYDSFVARTDALFDWFKKSWRN
jgi:hypothetical protein